MTSIGLNFLNNPPAGAPLIRCPHHPSEYITNICCKTFRPLCPECLDEYFKQQHSLNMKPEVDTLIRVRDMCSLKVRKIAEAYDEELKRLGIGEDFAPDFFIKKTLADLEDTRTKLHRFIDEYVNNLKSSFISRSRKDGGDYNEMRKIIDYIQGQMYEMATFNNLLGTKHLVDAIQKVSKIDSQTMLHDLKLKLALLKNERDIIDVKLDESEMLELSNVLKRILSISNKKIKNLATLDAIANIDFTKAEPPVVKKYFENKFGIQDTFAKVISSANPFYQGSDIVDTKNYFMGDNHHSQILTFPINNTNKLKIVNLRNFHESTIEITNLKAFMRNSKSIVLPNGEIFVTGGYVQETDTCLQENFRINMKLRKAEPKQKMRVGRASHGICCIDFMVYICGGKKSDQGLLSSFERYDALEDKWEMLPNCEFNTVRPLLIPFREKYIYKIGGFTHSGFCNAIERYDIEKNQWRTFDYTINMDQEDLNRVGFGMFPSMSGVQINQNTMLIFGGYTEELKPRKQSFLLSVDTTDSHIISLVNKHKLSKASGFSNEQVVISDDKIFVLGDQYSIQTGSPLQEAKNLYIFENGNWKVRKLS